jgi:peptide/nickel transport system substrate-binding protein
MKRIIFLTLAVLLTITLVLVGCNKATTTTSANPLTTTPAKTTPASTTPASTTPAATTPAVTTTPPPTDARLPNLGALAKPEGGVEGGRLQLQSGVDVNNIGDPMGTAGPSDAAFSFPCVEPLVIIDKNNNLAPWLAEEILPAADYSSLTLKLRQGIKFTDGTPFNAEAAKYNIDDGINSTMWPNMKKVQQCVVVDDYTIRLDFVDGKWDWTAVKSLAGFWSVMMFSPTYLQNHTAEEKMTTVVGTGPFILTGYTRGQKLTYDRNDNYWRGKPYLDGIDYNIIPDATVALLAYKAGDLDLLGVQPKDAQGLIDAGFKITQATDMVFNMCVLPSSRNPDSPLADLRVRQAFEYALDKQELVDALTYGYGVPTNQLFCLPPYMDPTVVGYPHDIAKAKALLAAAGFPDGLTTTLYYVNGMPTDLPLAMQGQVAEAGITLNLEGVDYIKFVAMIQGGEGWEGYVFSYGFPGTTVDPASTLGNGALNAVKVDGKWTPTTWISCDQPDELCDLFAQSNQETDTAKRVALIQEISKKMTDTYCQWTYIYYVPTLTSLSPRVHNYTVGQYIEFQPYTFCWLEK